MSKRLFLFIVVLLGLVFISEGVNKVHAATIHVVTTEDNVPRSLRTAIRAACNNEEDTTIILPAGTYILGGEAGEDRCLSGDLDIATDYHITITGAGAATTIVDGNGNDRVFHIHRGTVSISGVAIINGKTPNGTSGTRRNRNADHGGGIYNEGDLTLSDCIVTGNAAGNGYFGYAGLSAWIPSGCGGYGGGIYNTGTLHLSACVVRNNKAGDGGSGPFPGNGGPGGGIYNRGTQILINCSIIDNSAGDAYYDGSDHSNSSGWGGDG
ncbi:MAG: hypothetical protein GY950_15245, partial [bacterium]|nr:hypothetical protein [bacterium]